MINLPTPYAAARITAFLSEHLCWSAFWDKRDGVWRVSENDPDSDLYAESGDADTVIAYMTANSRDQLPPMIPDQPAPADRPGHVRTHGRPPPARTQPHRPRHRPHPAANPAQLADGEPAPPGPAASPAHCRGYLGRGPT